MQTKSKEKMESWKTKETDGCSDVTKTYEPIYIPVAITDEEEKITQDSIALSGVDDDERCSLPSNDSNHPTVSSKTGDTPKKSGEKTIPKDSKRPKETSLKSSDDSNSLPKHDVKLEHKRQASQGKISEYIIPDASKFQKGQPTLKRRRSTLPIVQIKDVKPRDIQIREKPLPRIFHRTKTESNLVNPARSKHSSESRRCVHELHYYRSSVFSFDPINTVSLVNSDIHVTTLVSTSNVIISDNLVDKEDSGKNDDQYKINDSSDQSETGTLDGSTRRNSNPPLPPPQRRKLGKNRSKIYFTSDEDMFDNGSNEGDRSRNQREIEQEYIDKIDGAFDDVIFGDPSNIQIVDSLPCMAGDKQTSGGAIACHLSLKTRRSNQEGNIDEEYINSGKNELKEVGVVEERECVLETTRRFSVGVVDEIGIKDMTASGCTIEENVSIPTTSHNNDSVVSIKSNLSKLSCASNSDTQDLNESKLSYASNSDSQDLNESKLSCASNSDTQDLKMAKVMECQSRFDSNLFQESPKFEFPVRSLDIDENDQIQNASVTKIDEREDNENHLGPLVHNVDDFSIAVSCIDQIETNGDLQNIKDDEASKTEELNKICFKSEPCNAVEEKDKDELSLKNPFDINEQIIKPLISVKVIQKISDEERRTDAMSNEENENVKSENDKPCNVFYKRYFNVNETRDNGTRRYTDPMQRRKFLREVMEHSKIRIDKTYGKFTRTKTTPPSSDGNQNNKMNKKVRSKDQKLSTVSGLKKDKVKNSEERSYQNQILQYEKLFDEKNFRKLPWRHMLDSPYSNKDQIATLRHDAGKDVDLDKQKNMSRTMTSTTTKNKENPDPHSRDSNGQQIIQGAFQNFEEQSLSKEGKENVCDEDENENENSAFLTKQRKTVQSVLQEYSRRRELQQNLIESSGCKYECYQHGVKNSSLTAADKMIFMAKPHHCFRCLRLKRLREENQKISAKREIKELPPFSNEPPSCDGSPYGRKIQHLEKLRSYGGIRLASYKNPEYKSKQNQDDIDDDLTDPDNLCYAFECVCKSAFGVDENMSSFEHLTPTQALTDEEHAQLARYGSSFTSNLAYHGGSNFLMTPRTDVSGNLCFEDGSYKQLPEHIVNQLRLLHNSRQGVFSRFFSRAFGSNHHLLRSEPGALISSTRHSAFASLLSPHVVTSANLERNLTGDSLDGTCIEGKALPLILPEPPKIIDPLKFMDNASLRKAVAKKKPSPLPPIKPEVKEEESTIKQQEVKPPVIKEPKNSLSVDLNPLPVIPSHTKELDVKKKLTPREEILTALTEADHVKWKAEQQQERIYLPLNFVFPRLVIISSKVPWCHALSKTIRKENGNILAFIYDFETWTFDDIIKACRNAVNGYCQGCRVKSIMILCKGGPGYFYMLRNFVMTPQKLSRSRYRSVKRFWQTLGDMITKIDPEEAKIHIIGADLETNSQGQKLIRSLLRAIHPNRVDLESPLEHTHSGRESIELYFDYRKFLLWRSRSDSEVSVYDVSHGTKSWSSIEEEIQRRERVKNILEFSRKQIA